MHDAEDMSNHQIRQDEISAYIGRRVREARKQAGVLQGDLAVAAGLDQAELSRIERGQKRVYVDALWAISKALRCPMSDLLPPEEHEDIRRAMAALATGGQMGGLELIALGSELVKRG